jgi:hypothetical protein
MHHSLNLLAQRISKINVRSSLHNDSPLPAADGVFYQAKLSGVEPVDLSSHYPSQGVSWIYVRVKCHREKLYTTTLSRIPRGSSQRCPSRVILHLNNLGSKSGLSILTLSKLPSNLILTKAVIMHQDQHVLVYPRSPLKQHPVVHIMVLRYLHHHYRH